MSNFYQLNIQETLKELGTGKNGLTQEKAEKRLEEHGENKLKKGKKISKLQIFISQFKDFLILILLAAAVISFLVGHQVDTYLITAIVIANGVFGFLQDWKAEKSIEALKKMTSVKTTVLRNGEKKTVDSKKLLPGDLILLETGATVPADARLIEQHNLKTDESNLTGESVGVEKHVKTIEEDREIAERENTVYKTTNVVRGRGKAVVTRTGMDTEIGKVATEIQEIEKEKSPFQKEINRLGKKLGVIILGVCTVIIPILLIQGTELLNSILTAIALAVAAVPEGLPAVVTLTLALGTKKMTKRNALVRKLPVVESLGSVDVICADKTGTLTEDRMVVERIYFNEEEINVTGGFSETGKFKREGEEIPPDELELMLKAGMLCNNSDIKEGEIIGDPTEAALIQSGVKAGLDRQELEEEYERIGEIPFSSKRKQMTTIHRAEEGETAFVKGAPKTVLEECDRYLENGEIKELTDEKREKYLEKNKEFAGNALRVLALAYRELEPGERKEGEVESNLIFLGLQGMIDPPREEVKEAIDTCREAGIRVIMITGDNEATARAIGKELGFREKTLTGKEIESMTSQELKDKIEEIDIYARISPKHKVDILNALKEHEHIIAMTGDGVNDAPALKRSDIGVSMGKRGTDVAQQASDMVLLDDNFNSVKDAVAEGRGVFDNIRKFVNYLLSANMGEVLLVFLVSLLRWGLALTAVMLLWINLLTDGLPALALGTDPKSREIMKRKPRPKEENVINRRMEFSIFGIGAIIALVTLGLFKITLPDIQKAQTIAFTSLVVFELVRIQAIRSRYKIPLLSNKWLGIAILSSIALQLTVLYTPLNALFGVTPLGYSSWALILGGLLVFALLTWILVKIENRAFE